MQDNLIAKLKEISTAYKKTAAIEKKINNVKPDDNYERNIIVPAFPGDFISEQEIRSSWDVAAEDNIRTMEKTYARAKKPSLPDEPDFGKKPAHADKKLNKDVTAKSGCMMFPAGMLAVMGFFALFTAEDFFTVVVCLVLIAVGAVVFLKGRQLKTGALKADQEAEAALAAEYEEKCKNIQSKYEKNLQIFQEAMADYEKNKAAFLQEYTEWREIYLAHLDEEKKIAEQLEADRIAGQKKIRAEEYAPAKAELDSCNDLLEEKYLPHADTLIGFIQSGRADDLKEALNLLEEQFYRERQLQLQREQEQQRREDEEQRHREQMAFQERQEWQRQREEDRRRDDEQRRHQEQMDFQRDQEYQRREDERRQRDADERRRKEAEADARRQEIQAADRAKREAENRCIHCANKRNCSLRFSHPQNCSAFRP